MKSAWSQDTECQAKIGKQSICEIAKQIAAEMAKELPMQINRHFTIEKAFSYKNTLTSWGRFNFNEKGLNKYLSETKTTQKEFQNNWAVQAKRGLCYPGSASHQFITAGGIMQYTYVYKNNQPYMTLDLIIA